MNGCGELHVMEGFIILHTSTRVVALARSLHAVTIRRHVPDVI